ncbi:MAG: hypothetical protein ACHQ51_12055 [Elusimicrobiota bacterium]
MKNPLPLLILILAAVVAASADDQLRSSATLGASAVTGSATPVASPVERCDSAWLTKAQSVASRGGTPADPNKFLTTQTVDGAVFPVVDIANSPKLCDANVWGYLVAKAPAGVTWYDARTKSAWDLGINEQLKILLAVNDLYKLADADAADAVAKADAVSAAAAQIEKSANPAELKAALSLLLKDPPAAAPKAGAKPVVGPPVPGAGVMAFRKAVVGFASDLAVHSAGRQFAAARGVDAKMAADFWAAPGASYAAAAGLAGKDGKPNYPDSVANDASYALAVKYLTEPAQAQGTAVLSELDKSLRDRVAAGAAAVDAAVAAARKRLNGQSVKATLAAVAHEAAIAGKPAPDASPAKGSLGADVLERLKGTKEYSELNSLYDNKSKADPAWANSADGKAAYAQMETMRKDAASTAVVQTGKGKAIQYSVGGQKVTDTGIVVADVVGPKTDKEYHDFIASAIASVISSDGKVTAVLAVLRGKGGPNDPIVPALKPGETAAVGDLPAKPEKPADKALAPWEALAKAAPGSGLFGWLSPKETAERYAAHENEAISETAADAMRARARTERSLNSQGVEADRRAKADEERRVAAAAAKAKTDEENLRQAPQDPDLSAAEAARVQKEQIAAREKAAVEEQAKIRAEAAKAKAARDAEAAKALAAAQKAAAEAQAAADAKSKALDATVGKAYDDGIAKSEAQLHTAYKTKDDARRSAAEKLSGYTGQFYRVERVDKFFTSAWEGDKLPAATAACKTQLGFKLPVANGSGFKDPSADNVDGYCGVRDGLVALLKSYRGSVSAPVAAPAK